MKIKREIELNIQKVKGKFVCRDAQALQMLMGTSSCLGNLSYYKVEKVRNKYVVDVAVVHERLKVLQERVDDYNGKLKMVKLILGVK